MTTGETGSITIPLFERFPRLRESLPRVELGAWPTPVIEAARFAKARGLKSLHIKREDKSHPRCGGNKVRGLEFLLGEARSRDIRTLVTFSSAGSHHISRTAFHARKFNIRVVAVFVDQPPTEYLQANLGVGIAASAEYIPANYFTVLFKTLGQIMRNASGERSPCLYVSPGGTSPLTCIGHVNAALELRRQIDAGLLPMPDYIYVPLGSLGTAAGLALGCRLAEMHTHIVGITASYRIFCTRGRLLRLAYRTMRLMRRHDPAVPHVWPARTDVSVFHHALGKGYAKPTQSGRRLIQEMLELEGIQLDGTYTSKTLDGALQYIEQHKTHEKCHLLWHTFDTLPLSNPRPEQIPPALRRYFFSEQDELPPA